MAKQASKSRKSVVPSSLFAVAVNKAASAFQPILSAFAADVAEAKSKATSRSADAVRIIGTLFADLPEPTEYSKAVEMLFGNGVKGKAHVKGSIGETLAKDAPVSIRSFLQQCRVVASNWTAPGVKDAAEKSGVRAGYDAAKPKAASETAATTTTKATQPTLVEIVGKTLDDMGGVETLLAMIESRLLASKDSIGVKIIHDARVAFVARVKAA